MPPAAAGPVLVPVGRRLRIFNRPHLHPRCPTPGLTFLDFVINFAIVRIPDLEIFELQAKLCATMGNANRLRIIEVLKLGEASVGAIAEALGCTISTASQHLRLMRDANLLAARKEGQAVYYRLRSPKVVECCQMVRNLLIEDLQAQGRLASDYDAHGPAGWADA